MTTDIIINVVLYYHSICNYIFFSFKTPTMSRPSHSSTKTTTTTPTNTLPIFIERNRILKAVSENQAVIIVGTTGSGIKEELMFT